VWASLGISRSTGVRPTVDDDSEQEAAAGFKKLFLVGSWVPDGVSRRSRS
jgi:hypothetical protein